MRRMVGIILVLIVLGAFFWEWDSGEMKDPKTVIGNSVEDIRDKINSETKELVDTGDAIEARFDTRANDMDQVNGRKAE